MNTKNKLEQAAKAYVSRFGWAVLPLHSINVERCTCQKSDCSSPGKHPLTQNGVKDASNDFQIISSWWKRWPFANVGIATSTESSFFVLDVDGQDGADSLQELEEKYGALPHTVEQLTGSGGRHILFKYPVDIAIGNKVALAPGLDIRGNGGYIVAAPSSHISGRLYHWEASSRPGEVVLAEAPGWLLKMLEQPKGLSRTVEDWRTLINEGVAEGKRNATVASLAGLLLKSIEPFVALDLILAWNKVRCNPPLTDNEVARTVDSIARLELQRRKGGRQHGRA